MSMTMKEYEKWRESEAYAVPMTPDGVKWSQERWRGFNTGYRQAMKDVINLLMIQHEAARGSRNYWHVAANLVRAEFLPDNDTSEKRVQKSVLKPCGYESKEKTMCRKCGQVHAEAIFDNSPPATRREWVGLTDEDILEALDLVGYDTQAFEQAYAIEAKLKEKNT